MLNFTCILSHWTYYTWTQLHHCLISAVSSVEISHMLAARHCYRALLTMLIFHRAAIDGLFHLNTVKTIRFRPVLSLGYHTFCPPHQRPCTNLSLSVTWLECERHLTEYWVSLNKLQNGDEMSLQFHYAYTFISRGCGNIAQVPKVALEGKKRSDVEFKTRKPIANAKSWCRPIGRNSLGPHL